MTIQRYGTTARYSDIVVHNQIVYVAEVPSTTGAHASVQTQEILQSLDTLLQKAGSNKAHILSATIYLTDMADYDAVNVQWDAWIPRGTAPSRACVQVSALAHPGWRVEVALTAAVAPTNFSSGA